MCMCIYACMYTYVRVYAYAYVVYLCTYLYVCICKMYVRMYTYICNKLSEANKGDMDLIFFFGFCCTCFVYFKKMFKFFQASVDPGIVISKHGRSLLTHRNF